MPCSVHCAYSNMPTAIHSTLTKPDVDKALCLRASFPCLCVPCAYLRVPFVRACSAPACTCLAHTCALCLRVVTMLVFLDTVTVGILLWRNVPLARLFKGAPVHRREHPGDVGDSSDFHSSGYQTPNPLFVRVLLLFTCTLLCTTAWSTLIGFGPVRNYLARYFRT